MTKDATHRPLTRRRLLIAAGSAAIAAAAGTPLALAETRAPQLYRWRGTALGSSAEMLLDAGANDRGAALAELCLAEIRRLEAIFSLFDPNSAISRLNREGRLADPPPEMIALLALCRRIWRASDGAFDPTVQPLWRAWAEDAPPDRLERARAAIGLDKLRVTPAEIAFAAPGMAITLNGIAQGFITDRVAALLGRHGLAHSLLQLGETRVLGSRPDGEAWSIGLDGFAAGGSSPERMDLKAGALAVTSAKGPPMPGKLGNSHLLDPRSGTILRAGGTIAIAAPRAALADGLSTALAVMSAEGAAARLLRAFPDARVLSL